MLRERAFPSSRPYHHRAGAMGKREGLAFKKARTRKKKEDASPTPADYRGPSKPRMRQITYFLKHFAAIYKRALSP